jgi:hypothetical protein
MVEAGLSCRWAQQTPSGSTLLVIALLCLLLIRLPSLLYDSFALSVWSNLPCSTLMRSACERRESRNAWPQHRSCCCRLCSKDWHLVTLVMGRFWITSGSNTDHVSADRLGGVTCAATCCLLVMTQQPLGVAYPL